MTVVEFLDRIPMVDKEFTSVVEAQLEEVGINIITRAKAIEIEPDKVIFEKDGKLIDTEADNVYMAVGCTPNIEGLDIEKTGVKTKKGAIVADEYLRVNIDGIYAIGDVNVGSYCFHGKVLLQWRIFAEIIKNGLPQHPKCNIYSTRNRFSRFD